MADYTVRTAEGVVLPSEHFDVLIVGAGLSGIGAGYHLQTKCEGMTYAILETRAASGGTWDLFRYPGIRSDSDMSEILTPPFQVGQRGPAEHERREQIITAAGEHFCRYGYNKTTVADLAKAIGLSTAYIYKFFESKQAIGQSVCRSCTGSIEAQLRSIVESDRPAAEKLRLFYKGLVKGSVELFFGERKLHDIVTTATNEKWESASDFNAAVTALVTRIVIAGRDSGEFERKTPLDETCNAIMQTIRPFKHGIMLEQNLDTAIDDAEIVARLVLRSLAP